MNGSGALSSSLNPLYSFHSPRHHPLQSLLITSSSFSPRRRRGPRRRRRDHFHGPTTSPSPSIDVERIADRYIRRLLSFGSETLTDLRTSIRVDPVDNRIVLSCRRSSLLFLLSALAAAAALRVLGIFASSALSWGPPRAVVRRDRSLGGREVVVGTARSRNGIERKGKASLDTNPRSIRTGVGERLSTRREAVELPEWWPAAPTGCPVMDHVAKEELQREANRLLRAIVDNRMRGMDYEDNDIVQLRDLCRTSGAKVSFGTANGRDSFFRASVDFVLNSCSRIPHPTATIEINGEEARKFMCGLADNIGLDAIHAARIICAAVAARTRSCFLQSWALEGQGKRIEALEELSKLCCIFQTFPPAENSPEMEMVASGLKKSLGIEQRKHLLVLFEGVCASTCHRIAEEALDLIVGMLLKAKNEDGLQLVLNYFALGLAL